MLLCVVLVAVCVSVPSCAFNFDVEYAQVFDDPQAQTGSYFGYTVALQRSNGDVRLLVGAPRANSTYIAHQAVREPGALYRCNLNSSANSCEHIILDTSGNEVQRGIQNCKDKKDYAWIGGALDVHYASGSETVVCAPRWKNQFFSEYYLMNGACYYLTTEEHWSRNSYKLLPLINTGKQGFKHETDEHIIFYYSYGEAGISVHIVEDGSELLIGAPGVFEWKGTVIRYRKESGIHYRRPSRNPYYGHFGEPLVPNPYRTSKITSASYMGYSVSSGKFLSSSNETLYVSGAPRGASYRGTVFVFRFPIYPEGEFDMVIELEGFQMGEYFGSTLCVIDLNADGLDDLVIGAPLHSLVTQNSAVYSGDEGRVYVYLNEDGGRMKEMGQKWMIMGSKQRGARFGMTIANIGDINLDGHPDIAVGAPYEDNGHGAVYIYHGDKHGIVPQYVQRIMASDVNPSISTFGVSISRGIDTDNNHYTDIAIGAYNSGHVTILRSRPIIKFEAQLSTDVEKILINGTGFNATACVSYSGKHAPQFIDAEATIIIDPLYARGYILSEYGSSQSRSVHYSMMLEIDSWTCKTFPVTIRSGNQDLLKPIDLKLTYGLKETSPRSNRDERGRRLAGNAFCKTCPVVNPQDANEVRWKVPYATGCGDEVCRTDLIISGRFPNIQRDFIIGSSREINLVIALLNKGELAYFSRINITVPWSVPLIRLPEFCWELRDVGNRSDVMMLQCNMGNPLYKESLVYLELDASSLEGGTKSLRFELAAWSVGEEQNEADNFAELVLPLKTIADIAVTGKSDRDQYVYYRQEEVEQHRTMKFNHIYEVRNYGPSSVDKVKLEFKLPTKIKTSHGDAQFLSIYAPKVELNAQPIICNSDEQYYSSIVAEKGTADIPTSGMPTHLKKRSVDVVIDSALASAMVQLPLNRTLFLNCSMPDVHCVTVICIAGSFQSSQIHATVNFQLQANFRQIEPLLGKKDILVISSSLSASIEDRPLPEEPQNNRPDVITLSTVFFGKMKEPEVDTWVIAVSAAVGLLILLFIIMGLVKMGFFRRSKKEELEALKMKSKAEEDFGPTLLNNEH